MRYYTKEPYLGGGKRLSGVGGGGTWLYGIKINLQAVPVSF